MNTLDLLKRAEKGSALTPTEFDGILTAIEEKTNALIALLGRITSDDGVMPDGLVSTSAKLADKIVTLAKLADLAAEDVGKTLQVGADKRLALVAAPDAIGFYAYKAVPDQGVAANLEPVDVSLTQERFDDGDGYDAPNSVFKAPVDGMYHFDISLQLFLDTGTPNGAAHGLYLIKGGGAVAVSWTPSAGNGTQMVHLSRTLKLAKNDEVKVRYKLDDPGNSTWKIAANADDTMLGGFRVC